MGYDKVVDSAKLDGAMSATADAIRGKTGGAENIAWDEDTGFADAVDGIKTGRMPVSEKDVNFYDYDGTLLYSYTVAEAQALTELPPAPVPQKEFLVFQEWNWTLEQIKEWGRSADIGAIYETTDGMNRFVIKIPEGMSLTVPFIFNGWGASITVDWGDGTQDATTKSETVTLSHTYANCGEYTITMRGHGVLTLASSGASILGSDVEATYLREVYLSGKSRLGTDCFLNCINLEVISVPKNSSVTQAWARFAKGCRSLKAFNFPSTITSGISESFADSGVKIVTMGYMVASCGFAAFDKTRNLKRMILPQITSIQSGSTQLFQDSYVREVVIEKSLTTLPNNTFAYCSSLVRVSLPNDVQSIGSSAFVNCKFLQEFEIPSSVTSIGANAFSGTKRIKTLKFKPVSPPVVENANAFTNLNAACVVEVPAGSLDAYKNATNYGTIAAQMVGV